ncbi:MAG: hypothetical protein J0L92_17300 [Deltaproteobacteria bacterium]|nr:hypothetical protein [Deltaproteobacteria bacterium]
MTGASMSRHVVLLLAASVLAASIVGRAAAQDAVGASVRHACAEGRERVDGRCCWPSQTFSDDVGRCVGAPVCPSGLVEHGDACVAPSTSTTSAAGSDASIPDPRGLTTATPSAYALTDRASARSRTTLFATNVDGWPEVAGDLAAPHARATEVHGEDEELIIAALVVFDVGWVMGWLGTMLDEIVLACSSFSGGRVSCGGAAWSLIPFGGALGSAFTTPSGTFHNSGFGIGFSIASVCVQAIGGIMAIIAFANETTEVGHQSIHTDNSLSASLLPGAAGSDAGLTLELTF